MDVYYFCLSEDISVCRKYVVCPAKRNVFLKQFLIKIYNRDDKKPLGFMIASGLYSSLRAFAWIES
jgi:hypothetical protein